MSLNSTRNLAADHFQIVSNNIISIVSIFTNILGNYITANAQGKSRFIHLSYHFALFLSQFYIGTALNAVILIPIPGIYCIGWLTNASDEMKVIYIAIFFFLFGFQGELLAIILYLKLNSVARPDSIFKIHPILQFILIILFILGNHGFHWIVFYFSYSTREQLESFIRDQFPFHQFLLRYQFVWMIMSNKLYICFAVLNLCSTGLIVLVICINYILVLYELERRRAHLSKSAFQEHKVFIDEIGSHGILIFSMFVTLPCCWFVQFFVLEETDVSFMITICFLVFVSAPIPAMLSFLWRNSRVQMIRIFCCKRNNTVETLAARSLMQAA